MKNLTTFLLLGVFSVFGSSTLLADDPISIISIGDSITGGFHGTPSGTYRETVQDRLNLEGYNFDFVGEYRAGNAGYDRDHQGSSGASIQRITNTIAPVLQNNQPDYALVLAGTNNHFAAPDLDAFVDLYTELAETINENSPDVSIIFSTVPKFGYDFPARNYWTDAFVDQRNSVTFPNINAAIELVASRYDNVTTVDFFSEIDIETDLAADRIHPNLFGQQKLGDLFADELIGQLSATAVPEPSNGILLIAASLGWIVLQTRRRKPVCC